MKRRSIILASSLAATIVCATYAISVIIAPRWSFELTTDKSTYNLAEDVQITVTLENSGYMPHSFTSAVSNPTIVSVEQVSEENPMIRHQVWYTHYEYNKTTFTVSPGKPFRRTYVWNQTNTQNPWTWNTTYKPGTYLITAVILRKEATIITETLFFAYAYINVTET